MFLPDKALVKIVNGKVIIAAQAVPINANEIININSLLTKNTEPKPRPPNTKLRE